MRKAKGINEKEVKKILEQMDLSQDDKNFLEVIREAVLADDSGMADIMIQSFNKQRTKNEKRELSLEEVFMYLVATDTNKARD